jgi:hypothetical protein
MIQHPIPQNVTGYQFRLIGDMTIKQFVILSVGIAAAIFFYYTNLFFFIKWFFIILSAAGGFAVAFLPLEERPLDQWIVNYIRAIYRPTFFIWHKDPAVPEYFAYQAKKAQAPEDAEHISKTATLRRQQGLHSYLVTLPNDKRSQLDLEEESTINGFLSAFNPSAPPQAASVHIATQTIGPAATGDVPFTAPPATATAPDHNRRDIAVPAPAPTKSDPNAPTENLGTKETAAAPAENLPASSTLAAQTTTSSHAAVTDSSLPFPSTPTTPNTVVGMVLNAQGKILENAIVEVIDEQGLPVRATKTNQLGQFFSTTPLKKGKYALLVEKSGHTFDTIELVATGQIIQPLRIQAKQ